MAIGTPTASSPPGGVNSSIGPLTGAARLDAMSTVLARNWWLVALRGVFAILFGIVAFVAPLATILTLVLFFSAYMLVDGICGVVASMRAAQRQERWGLLLLEGLLDIVVGIVAFLMPAAAVWAFIYLVALWALVSGGLMLAAAFRLHLHYGRWWLVLGGVISVLFGLALLINPGMSAVVLTWWLGGYALAFGVMLVILAFRLRGRHEEAGRPAPTPRTA
ncbi:HdeD family acid-resistance protein [Methylobacterium planeticum]|uniref:HdeD family acid-resistance protein n=1 Tax=Methylobacterium planeticum TaxID=2615211 RepID=A0A6N6MLN0_9HYPH|nr:HdeD family acid-resistance protein [Methylobacterium planeticum]KAB1070666.1 HdeD family acid-resistance protein [Methylobacterium planeticum]